MKKFIFFLLVVLLLIFFGVCGKINIFDKIVDGKEKLFIVMIFYFMYDFIKNIVGDEGDVKLLIFVGFELYDYELFVKDMVIIYDVDVFVYYNENMEFWVLKVVKGWKKGVLNVIKGIENMVLFFGSDEDGYDYDYEYGEEGYYYELDLYIWVLFYCVI